MLAAAALVLLLSQELAPLVWTAVDAPGADYSKSILALRKHPDGDWKSIARVLDAGRQTQATPVVAIEDKDRLARALEQVKWSVGEVRTYDFGNQPGAFYRLELPRSPAKGRIPVHIDLMLPLAHAEWALVLRFSSGLFDLNKPIRVRVGAKTTAYDAKPSVNTLIRNYRRDRDPRRLYPAELVLRPVR